jgi:chitin synthase
VSLPILTTGPLQKYFRGENLHGNDGGHINIHEANMYLAEDRILCFELVTKKGCNYRLAYVKGASAETDVPDSIPEFISQRRRWLNGSFFASVHSLANIRQIFRTKHSIIRKSALILQAVYNLIVLLFNWFALANIYLVNLCINSTDLSFPRGRPRIIEQAS